MSLHHEEATTSGRYASISIDVSVLCCDHRDRLGRQCEAAIFAGLGIGDSVDGHVLDDAAAEGWALGVSSMDYCPQHAAQHREDHG